MNKNIYLDNLINFSVNTYSNLYQNYINLSKCDINNEINKIKNNNSMNEKGVFIQYNYVELSALLDIKYKTQNIENFADPSVQDIITLILIDDNLPVGYAHIDYDDNKYWFGVCILENYQGKGYGKKIMEYIFNDERIKNIDNIYLTVDKINYIAISLYKKYNFYIVEEKDTYFMMCLNKKYFL